MNFGKALVHSPWEDKEEGKFTKPHAPGLVKPLRLPFVAGQSPTTVWTRRAENISDSPRKRVTVEKWACSLTLQKPRKNQSDPKVTEK